MVLKARYNLMPLLKIKRHNIFNNIGYQTIVKNEIDAASVEVVPDNEPIIEKTASLIKLVKEKPKKRSW